MSISKQDLADKLDDAADTARDMADRGLDKLERGVDKAADAAHELTDELQDGAEDALRRARRTLRESARSNRRLHSPGAAYGFSRVSRGMDEYIDEYTDGLGGNLRRATVDDPAIDGLADRAVDAAAHGIYRAAECGKRARRYMAELPAVAHNYVLRKPGQSMLMAAALGAAVTLLLSRPRDSE